jgi:SAM-dependent methyltransferase
MRLDDPEAVRREYASEAGLLGRRAAYRETTGPDAREVAFEAVAEMRPRRVLEVGCGPGELAARIQSALAAEVRAIDISPRMVELTRERGVDAEVGDVQDLPFADASFDCAVAAWMLYHVADLDRALSELARVLRPGGRLVAVTNHWDHLQEVLELVGVRRWPDASFRGDDAPRWLSRHFRHVGQRDASGTVTFADRQAVVDYIRSAAFADRADAVPELDGPLVARRRTLVLVATR